MATAPCLSQSQIQYGCLSHRAHHCVSVCDLCCTKGDETKETHVMAAQTHKDKVPYILLFVPFDTDEIYHVN